MEEHFGALWHRFITRVAQRHYPEAAVTLASVEKRAGLLFRAFGGDPGLRVTTAALTTHGARRRWLAKIAGLGEKTAHASRNVETLQLPAEIAYFPDMALNHDAYLWLIVLAAMQENAPDREWIVFNQQATQQALAHFPGLRARYQRLAEATIALRIPPEQLPPEEAVQERLVQQALRTPGTVDGLPPSPQPLQPVPIWLYPADNPSQTGARKHRSGQRPTNHGSQPVERDAQRRRAEHVEKPSEKGSFLLPFRAESLLSWAEFVKVNRPTDDDPTADARRAAENMDILSLSQDDASTAARIRFDLDLPAASADDQPLGPGLRLPEWDFRQRVLVPDYCALQEMLARGATPCALPDKLRRDANRMRRQFEILRPGHSWRRAQPDGEELDLDACVRHMTDTLHGTQGHERGLYRQWVRQERDMACILLADLSLSTDAWVNNKGRVIDVIRDSLFLFAEALAVTGDRFALYGFSSLKRQHVRVQRMKTFAEPYNATVRGRINAIRPGYYTRMGAALRYMTTLLRPQMAARRLLLLLTDGKPNDLDQYEGRYGIEDTRMALAEARREGLHPFCVTIDQEADDYLPYLFGHEGFILIRHPEELPRQLPLLYSKLTL